MPWYLRAMDPGRRIVSIALVEAENGESDAKKYAPRSPDGEAAADLVIFTPRTEREDPCAAMKKHFERRTTTP